MAIWIRTSNPFRLRDPLLYKAALHLMLAIPCASTACRTPGYICPSYSTSTREADPWPDTAGSSAIWPPLALQAARKMSKREIPLLKHHVDVWLEMWYHWIFGCSPKFSDQPMFMYLGLSPNLEPHELSSPNNHGFGHFPHIFPTFSMAIFPGVSRTPPAALLALATRLPGFPRRGDPWEKKPNGYWITPYSQYHPGGFPATSRFFHVG